MQMSVKPAKISIHAMPCNGRRGSGTVLWSGLLPASRESDITELGQTLGGQVRRVIPIRRSDGGCTRQGRL